MKTFKDFINKDKNTNEPAAVFCGAGGPPDQPLITPANKPENKNPTGFCNAGGPREHRLVESIEIYDKSEVLRDPTVNNTVTDPIANDHKRFVKPVYGGDYDHSYTFPHTFPHLSDEQARHYQALAGNTQTTHPHYRHIVNRYTDGSYELNSHLYESHVNNIPHDSVVQDINVRHLDNLIAQHHTLHPMTVYTGPHFNPQEYAGQRVQLPAFTSTSLTPHVAKDFGLGGHILRIHLPAGHPHLFMDHESVFQGQSELVLPRNMKLRIAQQPSHIVSGVFNDHFEDRNPNQHKSTIRFWDAHVVQ